MGGSGCLVQAQTYRKGDTLEGKGEPTEYSLAGKAVRCSHLMLDRPPTPVSRERTDLSGHCAGARAFMWSEIRQLSHIPNQFEMD